MNRPGEERGFFQRRADHPDPTVNALITIEQFYDPPGPPISRYTWKGPADGVAGIGDAVINDLLAVPREAESFLLGESDGGLQLRIVGHNERDSYYYVMLAD